MTFHSRWVNATKLCKDGWKRFDHWNEIKASQTLIQDLTNLLATPDFTHAHVPNTLGDTAPRNLGAVSSVCKFVQSHNKTEDV